MVQTPWSQIPTAADLNFVTSTDIESFDDITGCGSANFIMLKGVSGTTNDFSGAMASQIYDRWILPMAEVAP